MKTIFLSSLAGLCLAACAQTFAASAPVTPAPEDTIIISMPDKSKMIVVVKNKEDLKKFSNYNVDSLIQSLGIYLNESALPGADTTLRVTSKADGRKGEVHVNVMGGRTKADELMLRNQKMLERQMELLDKQMQMLNKQIAVPNVPSIEKTSLEKERESLQKERESAAAELETLNKQLATRKEEQKTVKVRIAATDESGKTKVTTIGGEDPKALAKKNKPWYNQFNIDLGFNALTNTETYRNPAGEVVDYDLKPMGSRYVSLNWVTGSRIGGPKSPFRIQSGLEFNFNNFMFDNNVRIANLDNQVVFFKEPDLNLDKSKLTATYVSVPVMMGLNFKNAKGKEGFSVMAGGYAGYRIGSHTKIKYNDAEGDTKKDKARGSFNLQDYQYGISASIGYRGFNLFTKYNLSDLFKEDRGPQAQVINFGISF